MSETVAEMWERLLKPREVKCVTCGAVRPNLDALIWHRVRSHYGGDEHLQYPNDRS